MRNADLFVRSVTTLSEGDVAQSIITAVSNKDTSKYVRLWLPEVRDERVEGRVFQIFFAQTRKHG